jgi:hypothetical protein
MGSEISPKNTQTDSVPVFFVFLGVSGFLQAVTVMYRQVQEFIVRYRNL